MLNVHKDRICKGFDGRTEPRYATPRAEGRRLFGNLHRQDQRWRRHQARHRGGAAIHAGRGYALHLVALAQQLESAEIGLLSITESIDTTTPSGRLFFSIAGAFAELERDVIQQRTLEGMAAPARLAASRGQNSRSLTSNGRRSGRQDPRTQQVHGQPGGSTPHNREFREPALSMFPRDA